MIIELTKDRAIKSDNNQFMLCKLRTQKNKETGKFEEVWHSYLYFSTLQSALKQVPTQMLKESNANGWTECKLVLESTYKFIEEALS